MRHHSSRRSSLAIVSLVLVAGACGQGGATVQTPTDEPDPRLENASRLTLAPGQRVAVGENDGLRITFGRVASDSRCQPDVQCVWQGEVTVELRLAGAATDTVAALHTVREPRQVEYGGYLITLTAVTPAPSTGGIDPAAYRATLAVERQ